MNLSKINNKLRGYTLIFAIVFVVIVTCFSLLFLSYFKVKKELFLGAKRSTECKMYCYQGLSFLQNDSLRYDVDYYFRLTNGSFNTVKKKRWGGYDLFFSTVRNDSEIFFSKTALVGYGIDTSHRIALCLNSYNSPLTISDSVTLKGECYIPFGKIEYKIPVFPNTGAAVFFPSHSPSLTGQSSDSLLGWIATLNRPGTENMLLNDSIANAFTEPTLYISADTATILGAIRGNVIVCANNIIVKQKCRLDNVILIAKMISFHDSVSGCLQAFAGSITTGKQVFFSYPSILASVPMPAGNKVHTEGGINLGNASTVAGEVLSLNKSGEYSVGAISIGQSCTVKGGIFTNGNLIWDGSSCTGTIFCDKIYGHTGTTYKTNFVKNARFDGEALSKFFAYSNVFPAERNKKVVRWLNAD